MFSRMSYVLRETWASLARNVTLTLASLLTVIVSLLLVGGALLVRYAVENSLERWKDGVEFIVFMNPDATQDQIDAVEQDLNDNPQVKSVKFYDKDQAYAEFKRLYPDSPELVDVLTPEQMPTSFRVVPATTDSQVIDAIGEQFQKKAGVFEVAYAKKAVDWIRTVSRFMRAGSLVFAVVLLIAAVLLIVTSVVQGMFARRREIEVMKLVGATNWFIRVPFMVEGLLLGLIGSLLAVGGVWTLNSMWESRVVNSAGIAELQALQVTSGQLSFTCMLILAGGALVGAVASGLAVTFYVDV
ncbi:MAG TPA: permease-like cell division protein FtsX [Acidimicrobiales bacterium]